MIVKELQKMDNDPPYFCLFLVLTLGVTIKGLADDTVTQIYISHDGTKWFAHGVNDIEITKHSDGGVTFTQHSVAMGVSHIKNDGTVEIFNL